MRELHVYIKYGNQNFHATTEVQDMYMYHEFICVTATNSKEWSYFIG